SSWRGGPIAEVLFQRDIEEQQLLAALVADPGQVQVAAGERMVEVAHVEEEKAGDARVWFDHQPLEAQRLDLVLPFFLYRRFQLATGQRNGKRIPRLLVAATLLAGESPVEVIHLRGIDLGAR